MAERLVMAYFRSPDEVESAALRLRTLRASDISIERVGGDVGYDRGGPRAVLIGAGETDTYALAGNPSDTGYNPYGGTAAAVAAAAGELSGEARRDVVLTARVEEGTRARAIQAIRESGGTVAEA